MILGDYVKIKGGFAFKSNKFVKNGTPIIRIGDLKNNRVDFTNVAYYPENTFSNYQNYSLRNEDILIAMSGATTGKIAKIKNAPKECLLNQRVGKFEILDLEKLDQNFLYYFINSSEFQKHIWNNAAGAAQPNVSGKQIESIQVNFPDIETQREIVSILEKAENLKEKRKNVNEDTEKIIQSIFHEMFGDPVKNEKGWEVKTLDDVCDKLTDGNHFTPKILKEGYPFLTVSNMRERKFDYTKCKRISKTDFDSLVKNGCRPEKGDVLFSKDGTVGKVTEILKTENETILSSIALLRPKKKILLSSFLAQFLRTEFALKQAFRMKSGSAIRRIILKDIKQIKIPLPDINNQKKFIEYVNLIYSIKDKQKSSTKDIETLFDALMQKAFKREIKE